MIVFLDHDCMNEILAVADPASDCGVDTLNSLHVQPVAVRCTHYFKLRPNDNVANPGPSSKLPDHYMRSYTQVTLEPKAPTYRRNVLH